MRRIYPRRDGKLEWRIQGRNVEINDQIRSHIEEKLGQLSKHLPGVSAVSVELSAESTRSQHDRFVAQVTLDVGGSILRAEQRGANTKTAINSAAEILSRRIERYKTRVYRSERARHTTSLGIQQAEEAAQDAIPAAATVLPEGDLVKTKRHGRLGRARRRSTGSSQAAQLNPSAVG